MRSRGQSEGQSEERRMKKKLVGAGSLKFGVLFGVSCLE